MYCGEIAEDKVRGALGSFLQIFVSLGSLSQYVVGPYVSYLVLIIFSAVVPFLFAVTMWFVPESPYQHVMAGEEQKALEALQWLRGTSIEAVKGELAIIKDKVRGALGSLLQIMISVGLLSQYVVGPYVSYLVLTIFSVVVPFLFAGAMWFIPESPYQLIMARKNQQALESLQWLRGTKSEAVKEELAIIEENVRDMLANKATPRDLIATKATVTALYLSVGLVSLQQLTGINAILFYCQTIFQTSGSGLDSSVATIIVGTVMLLASTCTPFVVDSLGRRILLLFSAGGMAVSLEAGYLSVGHPVEQSLCSSVQMGNRMRENTKQAALGTFFNLQNNGSDTSSIGWLPVVSLVVYIIVYSVGFGSLPWAVMGELFTPNVKSMASSVSASICWFFAFLITKFFSTLSQELGSDYAIWIFGIFAVVAFVSVFFLLPETKGKSLQEIQTILGG
uniref:Major facilitator superfamily (MFS) profile domain-containing protein n=1 Tax=Timema cristinae TaxID=61476 RepID=A0A7R9CS24_TIMCR|nr:unnamed protein product [Timema cristinae]